MDQSPPPCGCVNELAHLTPSSTPKFLGEDDLVDLPEFAADHLREFERQDFSRSSFHEGAHAVCAAAFGWPIELVTVGSGGRFVQFGDVTQRDPLQSLLVDVAGIAGERIFDGTDRWTPDTEMITAIARARAGQRGKCDICKTAELLVENFPHEPAKLLVRVWSKAAGICDELLVDERCKAAISDVARALSEDILLSGDTVNEIVGAHDIADAATRIIGSLSLQNILEQCAEVANMKREIVKLSKQSRSAEFQASSFNEADNTVEVVWSTGAKVRRYSWRDGIPYDEELVVSPEAVRLERLNAGAPFLNTHADWSLEDVLGSVVPGSARIEGGRGLAKIRLSSAPGDADNVAKIRDGIIRNISVGYRILKIEKTEGDEGEVAVWRVVDWEPLEISAVPVPADAGSQVRSAPADGDELFDAVVVDGDALENEETVTDDEDRALVIEERIRCVTIIGLVRDAGFSNALALELIRDGASIEDVRESLSGELG